MLMRNPNSSAGGVKASNARDSNIELLRIVCMLGIIAHHCVVHGGLSASTLALNRAICYVIIPLGKIGFTCFLAISVWFLVDSQFKARRLIATWLEVLFYTVIMGCFAIAAGIDVTPAWFVGLFLPIGGSSHGFAAAYLAFYAFLPVLQIVAKSITKSQAIFTAFLLFYLQVCSKVFAQIGIADGSLHPFSSEFLLFVMCWFIMLVIKRWYSSLTKHGMAWFLIFLSIWTIVSISQPLSHRGDRIASFVCINAADENSFLYLLAGFSLFFATINLPKCSLEAVNKIASTTFGILLIHDHNTFRPILWEKILRAGDWVNKPSMPIFILTSTITIFIIGAVIDLARQTLFAKLTSGSSRYKKIVEAIDNALQNTGAMKSEEDTIK